METYSPRQKVNRGVMNLTEDKSDINSVRNPVVEGFTCNKIFTTQRIEHQCHKQCLFFQYGSGFSLIASENFLIPFGFKMKKFKTLFQV